MSRSRKTGDGTNDGMGDEKAGARRVVRQKPRSARQAYLGWLRRSFGSTEKILRRNRKTFTRLFAKEGRRLDKQEIHEQTHEDQTKTEPKTEGRYGLVTQLAE